MEDGGRRWAGTHDPLPDATMFIFWIIVPLMAGAVALAVVPLVVTSVREERRIEAGQGSARAERFPAADHASDRASGRARTGAVAGHDGSAVGHGVHDRIARLTRV